MTRDLTKDQFRAALSRHGFGLVLGSWVTKSGSGLSVGARLKRTSKGWVIDRRATLAKAIKLFGE